MMKDNQDAKININEVSDFLREQGAISIKESPSMFKELLVILDDYEFVIDKIIRMRFIADGYIDGE